MLKRITKIIVILILVFLCTQITAFCNGDDIRLDDNFSQGITNWLVPTELVAKTIGKPSELTTKVLRINDNDPNGQGQIVKSYASKPSGIVVIEFEIYNQSLGGDMFIEMWGSIGASNAKLFDIAMTNYGKMNVKNGSENNLNDFPLGQWHRVRYEFNLSSSSIYKLQINGIEQTTGEGYSLLQANCVNFANFVIRPQKNSIIFLKNFKVTSNAEGFTPVDEDYSSTKGNWTVGKLTTTTLVDDPAITEDSDAQDKALYVEGKYTNTNYVSMSKDFTLADNKNAVVEFHTRTPVATGEPHISIKDTTGADIVSIKFLDNGVSVNNQTVSSYTYSKDTWQHFMLVCNKGQNYELYMDGKIINTGSLSSNPASISISVKKDCIINVDDIKAYIPKVNIAYTISAIDENGNDIMPNSTVTNAKGKVAVNNQSEVNKDVLIIICYFVDDILKSITAKSDVVDAYSSKTITTDESVNILSQSNKECKLTVYVWDNTQFFRPATEQIDIELN